MRRFLKSRVIDYMFLSWASYWFVAPFVSLDLLFTVINGILMALWVGITVAYWRGTWFAVRDPRNSIASQLVLAGIAGLGLAITSIFAWGWSYQYLNQPAWMRMNIFRGWFLWVFLTSTIALLVASNADGNHLIPHDSWRRVFWVTAMAILIVVAIVHTIGGWR